MDESFQFFDIFILALAAGFLVYRLRGVLGRRVGSEPGPNDRLPSSVPNRAAERDNVIDLPGRRTAEADNRAVPRAELEERLPGLAQLRREDPNFDPIRFMDGARQAFGMIVSAYASGDRETLSNLLDQDILRSFLSAIDEREREGQSLITEIHRFISVDLVEAEVAGRRGVVTVKFVTEQSAIMKDRDGMLLDEEATRPHTATDLWTFSRALDSADPNWLLVATRSPN